MASLGSVTVMRLEKLQFLRSVSTLQFCIKILATFAHCKFGENVVQALSSHYYNCQSNIVIHSCIIIPQDLGRKAECDISAGAFQ